MVEQSSGFTRGFLIVSILILAFIVGVCIANVIYFNNLRTDDCTEFSQGTATTMFWLNLFITIGAGIVFIWLITRLLRTTKKVMRAEERSREFFGATERQLRERRTSRTAAGNVVGGTEMDRFAQR